MEATTGWTVIKYTPEEIQVSILSTREKYWTTCYEREGTVLDGCNGRFALTTLVLMSSR